MRLVISAGGASRRMGHPKALLPVPGSGMGLLRHMLNRLHPLGLTDTALVIANQPDLATRADLPPSVEVVPDDHPDAGPLGGLSTALRRASGWIIFLACDMPLINPNLLAKLCELTLGGDGDAPWDVVLPTIDGYAQPLHALYHRRCLAPITVQLAAGRRSMDCFLPGLQVRRITEDEVRPFDSQLLSFFNANTPAEWETALAHLAAAPSPTDSACANPR